MENILKGKVWKFGDEINTDLIIPGKFLHIFEPEGLAKHALEGVDKNFSSKVEIGDIIVAGNNFGCGSSREQAAICLKYSGICAIIAKSFARIFYRNAINLGLPIIVTKEIDKIKNNDKIEINMQKGIIKNHNTQEEIKFETIPKFLIEILNDGGLIENLIKKKGK